MIAQLGFDVDDESSIGTWGTSKSFYDVSDAILEERHEATVTKILKSVE